MTTDPGSTASVIADRAGRPLLIPSRRHAPGPTTRSSVGNLADEIVQCLTEGRHPAAYEVQAVAAKIWDDFQAGSPKIPWDDILPGCKRHKRMIAAARAALGEASGLCNCGQASARRYE
jgi:hypothetical protein